MEIMAKSRSDRGQKVKKVIFNIIQIGRVTTLKNRKKPHDSKTVSIFQIGWLVLEILAKTDFRTRRGSHPLDQIIGGIQPPVGRL